MPLTIQQQQELRHVEAYDLATFLQGFEQAVKEGYSLSLEHNETYPYGTIGHYIVKMLPKEFTVPQQEQPVNTSVEPAEASELEKVVQSTQEELKATVEAPKKAGRPAKMK